MTASECSEYYKKRLYHYVYVRIYSKWFVYLYIFLFLNIKFHFQVGNVQVQTYKAQLISSMNSPCLEDENIYSQSLG